MSGERAEERRIRPTLMPCPKRWQKQDGSDGGPCPAYLDVDESSGEVLCADHGVVGTTVGPES